MKTDKVVGVARRAVDQAVPTSAKTVATSAKKTVRAPAMQRGGAVTADVVTVRAEATQPAVSDAVLERAVTLGIHLGKLAERAKISQDIMNAPRAYTVLPLLRGFIPSYANAATQYHLFARAMLDGIGEATFHVQQSGTRLVELASFPTRDVRAQRMTCEYVAAALELVSVMADAKLIDPKSVIKGGDVASLERLLAAAEAVRGKPQRTVLGKPLSFVRVVDSVMQHTANGSGYPALSVEASAAAQSVHFISRNSQAQTALAQIITHGTAILRTVTPNAAGSLAAAVSPQTRWVAADATIPPQRLGAWSNELIAANRLGNHDFRADALRRHIELIVLDGFVDTPDRRPALARAAASWVGAYVDGLTRLADYFRSAGPTGPATQNRLGSEVAELLEALLTGPAASDIKTALKDGGYVQRLAALVKR